MSTGSELGRTIRRGTWVAVFIATGCGVTAPVGMTATNVEDGGSTVVGMDGGVDAGSPLGVFAISLTSPTPTREATATFTVSNCGTVSAVLVNLGAVPAASDAWQPCTTAPNAITGQLLGGMNQLRVWARSASGVVYDVPPKITVVRNSMFSLGNSHSCALVEGAVSCWGSNDLGQLGVGSMEAESPLPVPVPGMQTDVLEITGAPHAGSTCALKADGSVWCWGANDTDQLGNPTVTKPCGSTMLPCSNSPVPVLDSTGRPLTGVVQVAEGTNIACAVFKDGTSSCWGGQGLGQALNGDANALTSMSDSLLPSPRATVGVPTDGPLIAGGVLDTCIWSPKGTFCSGVDYTNEPPTTQGLQAALLGSSHDSMCPLTNCDATPVTPAPLQMLGPVEMLSVGYYHMCAIVQGSALCWGANYLGEYGDGTTNPNTAGGRPLLPGPTDLIAAGAHHACAREPGGVVACWGLNDYGQLGSVSTDQCPTNQTTAVTCALTPQPVSELPEVAALAAGRKQTCAAAAGQVWCWGGNDAGELGAPAYENCAPSNGMGHGEPLLCSHSPIAVQGVATPQ